MRIFASWQDVNFRIADSDRSYGKSNRMPNERPDACKAFLRLSALKKCSPSKENFVNQHNLSC